MPAATKFVSLKPVIEKKRTAENHAAENAEKQAAVKHAAGNVKKQSLEEKRLIKKPENLLPKPDKNALLILTEQAQNLVQKTANGTFQTKTDKTCTPVSFFSIERSKDASVFRFVYNGKRKMFNTEEFFDILKIVHGSTDENEARIDLIYRFFRERRDFLIDFALSCADDPRRQGLVSELKTDFTLKL